MSFDAPVDEFQLRLRGYSRLGYDVELFLGSTSLGTQRFEQVIASDLEYFRHATSPFDRARVTIPYGGSTAALDDLGGANAAAPPVPPGDDCSGPVVVTQGATAYSTVYATPSQEPWQRAASHAGDVWFEYTTLQQGKDLEISLCGGSLNTNLEVYTGTCQALELEAYSVYDCGLQGRVLIPRVAAGERFLIRAGGLGTAAGTGALHIAELDPPAPSPDSCLETTFTPWAATAAGGALYFDLHAASNITLFGLDLETPSSGPLGLEVFVIPGSHLGQTSAPGGAGWTRVAVDDGTLLGQGVGQSSHVRFASPWNLPQGNWGIALIGAHAGTGRTTELGYSTYPGGPFQTQTLDGSLTFRGGGGDDTPWSGGQLGGATWNGRLCTSLTSLGEHYCYANPNSTGRPARIDAYGSRSVGHNHVTVVGSDLPMNSFGFAITSRTPGFEPARGIINNTYHAGNICLSGAIGRFYGPGEIQHSGPMGEIRVVLDLTAHPTPHGPVAVAPGETWFLQIWTRDFGGIATTNMSDGLAIEFE